MPGSGPVVHGGQKIGQSDADRKTSDLVVFACFYSMRYSLSFLKGNLVRNTVAALQLIVLQYFNDATPVDFDFQG